MTENSPKPAKKLLEKWSTWVTFLIALLTLAGLLIDVPKKLIKIVSSESQPDTSIKSQNLAGIIWNEKHELLPDVTVYLSDHNLSETTDSNGRYSFEVNYAPKQQSVEIIARKDGYITKEIEASLGNTSNNFILEREHD
jgi:6-pyruvoyl-tetrahydropterin synthase